jgi:hypothetical protein
MSSNRRFLGTKSINLYIVFVSSVQLRTELHADSQAPAMRDISNQTLLSE